MVIIIYHIKPSQLAIVVSSIYLPLTLDWLVSWARIPIRQVVVWKLYSVKVALIICVRTMTAAPGTCHGHLYLCARCGQETSR